MKQKVLLIIFTLVLLVGALLILNSDIWADYQVPDYRCSGLSDCNCMNCGYSCILCPDGLPCSTHCMDVCCQRQGWVGNGVICGCANDTLCIPPCNSEYNICHDGQCSKYSDLAGDFYRGCCQSFSPPPPVSPTPIPGICSGITYFPETTCPPANSTMSVNIHTEGATNCNGNWLNYGLRRDGVSVGISGPCYADHVSHCNDGFHKDGLNVGGVGNHTLQFTVNNGSCLCNTATYNVGPVPPTGLNAVCLSSTQAKVSWNTVTGATGYNLRITDGIATSDTVSEVGGTPNNCTNPGTLDLCINGWTPTSMTVNIAAGNNYNWWVHSAGGGCTSVLSSGLAFRCVTPTPTPTSSPAPTCTVSLTSCPFELTIGQSFQVIANVNQQAQGVDFSTSGALLGGGSGTGGPVSFLSPPITAIGPAGQSGTITALATLLDGVTTCSDSCTISISNLSGWFQTKEGDVHATANIADPVPAGSYFSLNGPGGLPGVVSYNGSSANFGAGIISATEWLAKAGAVGTSYADFAADLGKVTFTPITAVNSISDPGTGGTAYYFCGDTCLDLTFNDSKFAGGINGKMVVFVDKPGETLTIDTQIIQVNPASGFLAFITSGNLAFSGNTQVMAGVYIANGQMQIIQDAAAVPKAFQAEGIFFASSFSMLRNLNDNSLPALKFYYRPDLWVNSPVQIWSSTWQWQELAP